MPKINIENYDEFVKDLANQILNDKDVIESKNQVEDEFLEKCLSFLRNRFINLPYPLKINGQDISKVSPIEIANSLKVVIAENGTKTIEIVSSNPNVEWSARRYAFLTEGNDPFNELRQRIDAGLNI